MGLASCDFYSLDEPQPNDSISSADAFTNLASAQGARAGLYDALQLDDSFDSYLASWQYFSDEADWSGTFPTREEFDIYTVDQANGTMAAVYTDFYEVINIANNLITNVPTITGDPALTPDRSNSLIAEGRFARALMYYHLTQGWVDVPLVTEPTTTTGEELNVAESPQSEIWELIESDLEFAVANLVPGQTLGMSAAAANALLARSHFMQGDYEDARNAALASLGDGGFDASETYLEDVIFSIDYSSTDGNSFAFFYGNEARNGRYSIHPSDALINAYEDGDIRFALSVDTVGGQPVGLKYDDFNAAGGSQSDSYLALRASEQALIIGESYAREGDYDQAEDWLNQVRQRAGLDEIDDLDDDNFEDAFLQEFFVELAMEGGHRLWNVRRVGRATEIFGDEYESCDDRWPFPQRELDRNSVLEPNSSCLSG